MSDLPPDVVESAERRVNAIFAKVIGGVLLWIGVIFVALFVWALCKISVLNRTPELGAFVLLIALAILAGFCSLVGWRLFLNRPNRFGSILSPLGWRTLAAMFAVFAAALVVFWIILLREGASTERIVTAVTSVASGAILCHWCLSAARQALTNATKVKTGR